MECPAQIEHVDYAEDGSPVVTYEKCPGTLDAEPVVNEATHQVEPVFMGDDTWGKNYYCETCGQTTVIADGVSQQ